MYFVYVLAQIKLIILIKAYNSVFTDTIIFLLVFYTNLFQPVMYTCNQFQFHGYRFLSLE